MDASEHFFFSFFEDELASRLLAAGEMCQFTDGTVIFNEGDTPDYMYLIMDGSIELTKCMDEGKSYVIATIGTNDFFGEFGILDKGPRSASAKALGSCSLMRLHADAVVQAMSGSADAGVKLAIQVIRKTRETNRKYVEDVLRRERLALVGKMLSCIVHDFRNPFAVIQMAAEMIKMQAENDWVAENCDAILEQLYRVVHMAEEVLDFTRGRTSVSMIPIDIGELLTRFERMNKTYLQQQGIHFSVEGAPMTIVGDDQRLIRVLQNLVYNAAEILGEDGHIAIRQENRERSVVIHVEDNGPGLPEDIRSTLFEAFTTRGKKNGLGLGLAIAKSIVQAHGGTITFTTELGKGTTFHVELPC